MACILSKEMTVSINTEARPANMSTESNARSSERVMYLEWYIMKMGIDTNPTIKSAVAKLIKRKCGRLRSFRLENMTMATTFPTRMMNASIPKEILQMIFQEFRSITSVSRIGSPEDGENKTFIV